MVLFCKKVTLNSDIALLRMEQEIDLNDDCLLQVFQNLSYESRVCCERVCKRWQVVSLQSWKTISDVNFEDRPYLNPDMVLGVLKRVLGHISSLKFPERFWNQPEMLHKAIKMVAPTIKEIKFGTAATVGMPVINILCTKAPNLKKLEFAHTGCIRHKGFQKLLKSKPDLESVVLPGVIHITELCECKKLRELRLEGTALDSRAFYSFISQSPTLESLTVDGCMIRSGHDVGYFSTLRNLSVLQSDLLNPDYGAQADLSSFPNLDVLDIRNTLRSNRIPFLLRAESWTGLSASCQHLRRLSVSHKYPIGLPKALIENFENSNVLHDMSRMQNLEYLNISLNFGGPVRLRTTRSLAGLKKLETLIIRITSCTVVESDLIYLVNELPRLKRLDVTGVMITRHEDGDTQTTKDPEKCIKQFCSSVKPRESTLELIISGCGYKTNELRDRWMYDNFIIHNTGEESQ